MDFHPDPYQVPALVVALSALAIAFLVLRAAPRAAANRFCAFYLVLVGGNFAAQFIGSGLEADGQRLWSRVATLFLLWDPAVLVYFASVFPRKTFFARNPVGTLLVAAVPVGLTAAFFITDPEAFGLPSTWQKATTTLYLAVAYIYCLVSLIVAAPDDPVGARTRQRNALLLGLGVALIPRLGLIVDDLALFSQSYSVGRVAARVGLTWLAFVLLWLASAWLTNRDATRRPRGFQQPWVLKWTVVFLGVLTMLWIGGIGLGQISADYRFHELTLYYPFRWLLFAAIVGYAIAKYQVFDIDLRLQRFARSSAPILLGACAFAAGYLSLTSLPPEILEDPQALGLIVAVVLGGLVAIAFRNLNLNALIFPRATPDEAYLRARKLEVYGASLEAAAAEGRLGAAPDGQLETLRAQLGISPEEHQALERLVRRVAPPRLEDRIVSGHALFGRYRILRRLDQGGFADVFLAEDVRNGARVVVKRLHAHFGQDERVLRAFLREAEVAGRVHHPNVVAVHEILREGGDAYLVLDYVEGGNLEDALRSGGAQSPGRAVAISLDLLAGLEAVHAQGVAHRDLKPSNVLLDERGAARITDFGVAHVPMLDSTAGGLTQPGVQPGTLRYMSPEQALGRPVDGRADLYAVGAILFELATGRQLFAANGATEFELRRRVARGVTAKQLREAPPTLRGILTKALDPDPDRRYQTPTEMRRDLEAEARALHSGTQVSRTPTAS